MTFCLRRAAFLRGTVAALAVPGALAAGPNPLVPPPAPLLVHVPSRDGVLLAAAVYRPSAPGRYPALLAASPYRFDNDGAPALPVFLWNETGPIAWYVSKGYAYVHLDVRGSGRSGGKFSYFGPQEQTDLYDIVEWIAKQAWSNGNVGGIGQSYYARSQWMMGIQNPPHLRCIAPYDGDIDTYRFSAYTGGIPGDYPSTWYAAAPRYNNEYPFAGASRQLKLDYPELASEHPLDDAFWKSRAAIDRLGSIRVPVYSIGVWSKLNFALNGNIWGYELVRAPKKLLLVGTGSVAGAVSNFSSIEFHERFMLPFYDHYLKGQTTSYADEPPVRYFVVNADRFDTSDMWPPRAATFAPYYLGAGPTNSVVSLNDGALSPGTAPAGVALTSYSYPDAGWRVGVVGDGPNGEPDPVRRVLTFTSAPLEADLTIAGPIMLTLYASSTERDTNFIVKLSDQQGDATGAGLKTLNPPYHIVSKGWLRAALRRIDPARSLPNAPYYPFDREQPLTPNKVEKFEIALTPAAYVFHKGHRIRLEIVNGDSPVTDVVWTHTYSPRQVGQDSIFHDAARQSNISLPLMN